MIESKFREISQKINGKYNLTNFIVDGSLGSKITISIHSLNFIYKEILIDIKYEFGNSNVAEVKLSLDTKIEVPYFEMETKDNFSRLFSTEKNPWRIKSKNNQMSSNIKTFLRKTGLTNLANDECFEPIMKGENIDGRYFFNTKFYLGFNNKENSLSSIITFHKELIDYLKKNYCR